MERRNFIQKSAIGIIGYHIIGSGKESGHLFQTAVVHHWLHQIVTSTNVQKRSFLFLPAEFSSVVSQINTPFAKLGFVSRSSSCYFYGKKKDYCFYPLELAHHPSGMTDLVLPVLHKEENGNWKHIATINGYQIEALALASIALKDVNTPLQELLLPTVKSSDGKYFQTFKTDQGAINIKTRIYADQDPESRIELIAQNEILYSDIFRSKHCLTSSNNNI